MGHPWKTIEFGRYDWDSAVDVINEIDSNITGTADGQLVKFLRSVNRDYEEVEGWDTRSGLFFLDLISFETIKAYEDDMKIKVPALGYPSIINLVNKWQCNLYEGKGILMGPPNVDIATVEGQKLMMAHMEARKMCPKLWKAIVPGFTEMRHSYDEAKQRLDKTNDELNAYLKEKWPQDQVTYFQEALKAQFDNSDIGLYDMILTLQYDMCQQLLNLEEPEMDEDDRNN